MLGAGQKTVAEAWRMPPLTLAYLGDAVFELYVRSRLLYEADARPAGILHRQAVKRVKAAAQADALRRCMDKLTDEEADVVRRGRNAHTTGRRSAGPADYHMSTAFEALIGYLYLIGQEDRLVEIMDLAYQPAPEN